MDELRQAGLEIDEMTKPLRWQDRVAFVTGGSSGIGLATAKALAAGGAHVWLAARRSEALEAALVQVNAVCPTSGQYCGSIPMDVSNWEQVQSAVNRVTRDVGAPTWVINAAGVVYPGYFQDLHLEQFQSMMAINYFGIVHVTKAVLPGMLQLNEGYVVNISSVVGFIGTLGYSAYSPSKFAIRGFSDAIRCEFKPRGIHVSVVFPPDTRTPQLDYENQFKPHELRILSKVNRVMTAEAVAKSILAQAARGRYLIFPGWDSQVLYWLNGVAGGMINKIMDWLVARAQNGQRKA